MKGIFGNFLIAAKRVFVARTVAARMVAAMVLVAAAGAAAGGCSGAGMSREKEGVRRSVYEELRSVDKVVLARMSISKLATVEDLKLEDAVGLKQAGAALLNAVKIGGRKAAYSYDTYLRAYMDMSEFTADDVRVDEGEKLIEITLPPVRTEFEGRDPAFREEHYRVMGLRSPIDSEDRAELKERMNTALKGEVERNPEFRRRAVNTARAKGEAWCRSLAARDGYAVSVKFRD